MRSGHVRRNTHEEAYRVGLYKRFRSHGQAGFSVQSLRELTKMMLLRAPLPDDLLGDVYPFENKSDESVIVYLDQCGLPEIQLILVDLIVGESLGVTQWDVNNDGDGVEDSDFAYVEAMCKAEGIDPDHVREEMFPTPIEDIVSQIRDYEVTAFIKNHPARLDELTEEVLKRAPDLVSAVQLAAESAGYARQDNRWVKGTMSATASGSVVEFVPAGELADDADPGLTLDQIPAPATKKESKVAKPKANRQAAKLSTAVEAPWPWPTKAVDDSPALPDQPPHAEPVSGDAALPEVVEALS